MRFQVKRIEKKPNGTWEVSTWRDTHEGKIPFRRGKPCVLIKIRGLYLIVAPDLR